jgi:hypothetical protein
VNELFLWKRRGRGAITIFKKNNHPFITHVPRGNKFGNL